LYYCSPSYCKAGDRHARGAFLKERYGIQGRTGQENMNSIHSRFDQHPEMKGMCADFFTKECRFKDAQVWYTNLMSANTGRSRLLYSRLEYSRLEHSA